VALARRQRDDEACRVPHDVSVGHHVAAIVEDDSRAEGQRCPDLHDRRRNGLHYSHELLLKRSHGAGWGHRHSRGVAAGMIGAAAHRNGHQAREDESGCASHAHGEKLETARSNVAARRFQSAFGAAATMTALELGLETRQAISRYLAVEVL